MLIHIYDIADYPNDKKTKLSTFLDTEKVCIWMSPEEVTTGPPDWLEEQIKSVHSTKIFIVL